MNKINPIYIMELFREGMATLCSIGSYRVWQRDFDVWRKRDRESLWGKRFEHILFLFALGFVLGAALGGAAGARLERRPTGLAADDDGVLAAVRNVPKVLTGTDAIGDIDRMFDVMADRLAMRRRELRESEHLLGLLMDSIPLAVIYLDRDYRYRLINRTFEIWFGMSGEEVIGRHCRDVIGERSYEILRPNLLSCLDGDPSTFEAFLPHERGESRYVIGTAVPHVAEGGDIEGFFITINDISERRKVEEAVLVARDAAERADAAKTRFLAAASHDLRQPLYAMRLLTGVLHDRSDEPANRKIIEDLQASMHSMDTMMNALLDISELDSGAIAPDLTDFDVGEFLTRIGNEFAPEADEKGLDLRVVPSAAPVRSDPALLQRVVANLLSNAIRYTESGRVLMGCRRRGDTVRIEVWDTGIGIPPDRLDSIFEEYYQVGNPARDRSRGLGLGLALVTRIARLLGHTIDCSSTLGGGSMFSVEVPIGEAGRTVAAGAEEGSGKPSLAGRSVLVVEDDNLGLNAMRLWLESHGANVNAAKNGSAVIESVAEDGFDCDLVIADHRLPQGDTGAGIVRRVRSALGRDVPAIIVTGDTSADIRVEAENNGCRFARKPIDPDHLMALIGEVLDEPERAPTSTR